MKLCIVMPIFNEEESIEKTFMEWKDVVDNDQYFKKISFLLINDGSKDNTLNVINKLKSMYLVNDIIIINNKNIGHGQSCLLGYKYAVEFNYDYLLQLDSDGQCDPKYFQQFVAKINNGYEVVYGFRYYRKDGFIRFLVSRVLSFVSFFETGVWVWDPNVPYRLFKTSTVKNFLEVATKDFNLVNVLLALYHKKYRIKYIPIVFRDRHGGSPSVSTGKLLYHGKIFYEQLKSIKEIIKF